MFNAKSRFLLASALGAAALVSADPASATEGGTNLYALGTGIPGAGIAPPLEGVYASKTVWVYDGDVSASRDFIINGKIVVGVDATVVVDMNSLLWVPSTDVLGGTLSLGAVLPIGASRIDAEAILSGPGGGQIALAAHDSTLTVADPIAIAGLGWHFDKVHVQVSTMVNIPVGNYRKGQLANVSLHRWGVDTSLAMSWRDPVSGWDLTGKAGLTFNGRNGFTDYNSGDELHVEASVEKAFSPKFSAGIQGYYYRQISADKGSGAKLGAFKGRVAAVGATFATTAMLGRVPTTFRLQAFHEFDARNRLEGNSFFLSVSIPLKLNMPAAAAQ